MLIKSIVFQPYTSRSSGPFDRIYLFSWTRSSFVGISPHKVSYSSATHIAINCHCSLNEVNNLSKSLSIATKLIHGGHCGCCREDSKPDVSTRFSLLSVTVKSLKSVCANTRELKMPVPLDIINITIIIVVISFITNDGKEN